MSANPYRGEVQLTVGGQAITVRPAFAALVAAEQELGSLFALVERAGEGKLALREIAALFDHLSKERPPAITRERIGDAVVAMGMVKVAPLLRSVLEQILKGQ